MKNKTFLKKLGVSALSVLTAASMLPIASLNAFAFERDCVFVTGEDGKLYWYEQDVKMGVYGAPGNVWYDNIERGKEIYDPATDGWYWLDAVYEGAKAVDKEVFMPYIYSDEEGNLDNEEWMQFMTEPRLKVRKFSCLISTAMRARWIVRPRLILLTSQITHPKMSRTLSLAIRSRRLCLMAQVSGFVMTRKVRCLKDGLPSKEISLKSTRIR